MIILSTEERESEMLDNESGTRALDLVIHNPFGELKKMQLTDYGKWEQLDNDRALQSLMSNRNGGAINLRASPKLNASINRYPQFNSIIFIVSESLWPEIGFQKSREYLRHMTSVLPKFSWARIEPEETTSELYAERGLPFAPPCFMDFVSCFHIISKRGYDPYLDADILHKMPAREIFEHSDGTFEILIYDDPFAFSHSAIQENIVEVTEYLNKHRKDWL